ncbi:MAG: hypothetical protein HXY50_06480 [Ignavibacteriaceae bacterium]|nr:hypothetical protein [Ignavibacteriaceae bacterium]
MDHAQSKFKFTVQDKVVEFKSRKYNFKLEKIIIDRFGKDVIDEFNKTHKLNFNLQLEHAIADMPKLLEDVPNDFDWTEPSYDEILEVYFFFIQYKENAFLKQIELNKAMLALLNESVTEILNSSQANISKLKTSMPTPYS